MMKRSSTATAAISAHKWTTLPLVVAAGLVLAGCVGPLTKSPGIAGCAAFLRTAEGGTIDAALRSAAAGRRAVSESAGVEEVNLLILSGGGKYGSYGGGFLKGWSDAERSGTVAPAAIQRADIDIVTGISTGALLATFAAVGNAAPPASEQRRNADAAAVAAYQVNDPDLFVERGLLSAIRSNGLSDIRGRLDRIVDTLVRDNIAKVAALPAGRSILIGVVNLTDGRFYVADLVDVARSDAPNKADCYREILLASAAVPLQFPPRFIDGHPYVDGGVRFGTFLGREFTAGAQRSSRALATERGASVNAGAPGLWVNVRTIVNGNLSPHNPVNDPARAAACDDAPLDQITATCQPVQNDLLGIARRSAGDILVDQIYRDSLYRLSSDLRQAGVLGTAAFTYIPNSEIARGQCRRANPKYSFDRGYMTCLSGIGEANGRRQAWRDPEQTPGLMAVATTAPR